MNMAVPVIMVVLFLSGSLIAWSLLTSTTGAWDRYSENFRATADSNLQKLFVFADTRKLLAIYVAALLIVPSVLFLAGRSIIVVGLALIILMVSPKYIFARMAERRRNSINLALPDALQQIAGAMRAGSTFITAIQSMVEEQPGPISQEFSLLLREQRLGARLEEALDNLGERVQTEEMDLVISAAMIAQDVGGNLSEILFRLSETIRKKIEMEGKIRALTSQGVLQGYVVSALPFFVLFVLTFIEQEAIEPIYTSLLGWMFLVIILLLQCIGGLMIRKIVRIEI